MKIVVLDGYTENPGDLSWDELEKLGELTVYDRTAYAESPLIAERIGDAEIVVMNKTPISRATMDKCPNIKLIAVLATGYNVVDCACAREKGIPVVNVPTYGTASVSQFSIALLLEICHHIGHHSESVHAGRWADNADWCYWDYPLIELEGKTIGIIGFGRIGQAEGRVAKALGMNVLAYDLYPNDRGREIAEYVDLDTLYARADVVTLHCNLTPENTGMINKDSIAKMKDGVILINNARGGLVDEAALNDAIWQLIQLCQEQGVTWNDTLPMTTGSSPQLTSKSLTESFREYLGDNKLPTDGGSAEVLAAMRETGLVASSVCNVHHWAKPLSHPDAAVRQEGIDAMIVAMEDAKAYGTDAVLLVPGIVNEEVSYDDCWNRSTECIKELIPTAEKLGVKICIENVWNNFLLSPVEACNYVDQFESPYVKFYFDCGNILVYGWPEQWIDILDNRIGRIHIKEFSRKEADSKGRGAGFGVSLTEGDVNWSKVMEAARKHYRGGWLTTEQGNSASAEALADLCARLDRIVAL